MKNKLIILLVLFIPLAIFISMELFVKSSETTAAFSQEGFQKPRLIKFYSPMCSECKKVGENIENVIKDYGDTIVLEEINTNQKDRKTKSMISNYKVTVVPTLIFVDKTGNVTQKNEGMIEEIEIKNYLEEIK